MSFILKKFSLKKRGGSGFKIRALSDISNAVFMYFFKWIKGIGTNQLPRGNAVM